MAMRKKLTAHRSWEDWLLLALRALIFISATQRKFVEGRISVPAMTMTGYYARRRKIRRWATSTKRYPRASARAHRSRSSCPHPVR